MNFSLVSKVFCRPADTFIDKHKKGLGVIHEEAGCSSISDRLRSIDRLAGSDHVIVELSSSAPAASVAAAVGGEIERSIAGTNFYLMKVPSAAVFNQAAPLGVLGAELMMMSLSIRQHGF